MPPNKESGRVLGLSEKSRITTGRRGFIFRFRTRHGLVAPGRQIANLRVPNHDSRGQTMRRNQTLYLGEVHRFLDGLFDGDLHAKRLLSLTNATLGVIKTASLAVNTIGHAASGPAVTTSPAMSPPRTKRKN
jgi:hypothetical protein